MLAHLASDLPDADLSVLLHFLYSQCLPEGVDEAILERCVEAASNVNGLGRFVAAGKLYRRNSALSQSP